MRPVEPAYKGEIDSRRSDRLPRRTNTEPERPDADLLLGPRAILEAFAAGREFNRISIATSSENAAETSKIRALAKQAGVVVQLVEKAALDRIADGAKHQGIIASVAPYKYAKLEDLIEKAQRGEGQPFLVFLDGIMDPGNLGSIIRTANASGAQGVVITTRRCVQVTSAVARASAGALEHTPVARVANLAYAIEKAKEAGIWVAGLDMEGSRNAWDADLTGPIALVVGSEGSGMSKIVTDKCDFMVKIPMSGKIASLNAAVSFAMVAYERMRQTSKGKA